MSTLIFDFDGTLADSFTLAVDIMHTALDTAKPTPEEAKRLRSMPVLEAAARIGGSRLRGIMGLMTVRRHMAARISEVQYFEGMPQVLGQLHTAGHRLFIVTSNNARNAQDFLRSKHDEALFEGVLHCNVFFKPRGIRRLLKHNHLLASDCYYIGNEPLDVRAANKAGVHSVAVTWSGQDRAALEAANAGAVLDHPAALLPIFT
jgi:phosphoglycolate phosphatase-like HAD superfamily hydrolase